MARKNNSRNGRSRTGAQVERRNRPAVRSDTILSNATLNALTFGRSFKSLAASPRRFDQNGRRVENSARSFYSSSKKVDTPSPRISARDESRRDDAITCKSRPTNTKSNGGSRPYVPWCDRKK